MKPPQGVGEWSSQETQDRVPPETSWMGCLMDKGGSVKAISQAVVPLVF